MATKQNFDTLFTLELEHIARSPDFAHKKPHLLLHACCGPCSSAVLERLADHFKITIFYYNPNIHPQTEYIRRLEELALFLNRRRAKQQKNRKCGRTFSNGYTGYGSRTYLCRLQHRRFFFSRQYRRVP